VSDQGNQDDPKPGGGPAKRATGGTRARSKATPKTTTQDGAKKPAARKRPASKAGAKTAAAKSTTAKTTSAKTTSAETAAKPSSDTTPAVTAPSAPVDTAPPESKTTASDPTASKPADSKPADSKPADSKPEPARATAAASGTPSVTSKPAPSPDATKPADKETTSQSQPAAGDARPAAAAAAATTPAPASGSSATKSSSSKPAASSGRSGGSQPPSSTSPGKKGDQTLPLFLSLLAIVIAVASPIWGPYLTSKEDDSALQALSTQQTALVESVGTLQARLDEIDAGQQDLVDAIAAVKVPSLLLVADDLRDHLKSGEPFADTLNLFGVILGEDEPAVASVFELEPIAELGIPSDEELQLAFEDTAHAIVAEYQTVEAEGDLAKRVSETMAQLSALTSRLRWRLDGPPEDDGVISVVARADELVSAGAYEDAVTVLATLPDTLRAMTEDWSKQVELRASAEQAIADLDAYVIELVSKTQ